MKSRKRTRPLSQPDAPSTRKVRVVPIYRGGKKKNPTTHFRCSSKKSDTGILLSLPATLGRRNLAECWWKHCPNQCNAALPESKPCRKVCFAVRRKSHREAISKSMLEIDAQGRVRITAKNKQLLVLVDEQGRKPTKWIDWTSSVRHHLKIGNLAERDIWMEFYIEPVQIVSPDHEPLWLEATRKSNPTKRRRRFPPFSLSDSPSRRQLFFEDDDDDNDSSSSTSGSSGSSMHSAVKQRGISTRKKHAEEERDQSCMTTIDDFLTKTTATTTKRELSNPDRRVPQDRGALETQPPVSPRINARRSIAEEMHDRLIDTLRENRGGNFKASLGDASGAENKHRPHNNGRTVCAPAEHQKVLNSTSDSQEATPCHAVVSKKPGQEHQATPEARKTGGSEERSYTLFQSTQAPSVLASCSEDLFSECRESKAGQKVGFSAPHEDPSVPLRQPSFDHQQSSSSSSRKPHQEESAVLSLPLDNEDDTPSSNYPFPVHRSTDIASTRTDSLVATGSHDETTCVRPATCNSSQYCTWTLQDWKRYSESEPGSKFRRAITNLVLANNSRGGWKFGGNLKLPSLLGGEESII